MPFDDSERAMRRRLALGKKLSVDQRKAARIAGRVLMLVIGAWALSNLGA